MMPMKFVKNKSNKVIAAVLLAVCFSLFFCCGSAWAVVDAPDSVYVGDYANVLTEETEQYMIDYLVDHTSEDECWDLVNSYWE